MIEITVFSAVCLVSVAVMYWHTECTYSAIEYFNQVVYRVYTERLRQDNEGLPVTSEYPTSEILTKHIWRKFFFRDYESLYTGCKISLKGIVK